MTDRNLFPPGDDGVYDLGFGHRDDGGYAESWPGIRLRFPERGDSWSAGTEPVDMPDPVFEDYLVTIEVRVHASDFPEAVGIALEFLSEGEDPDAVRVERVER